MAGLAGHALTTGGFTAAIVAFATAAAVIVALMFILSILIARAQQNTVERLQATAPAIKKWGGAILVGIGAWFLVLGIFAERFSGLFTV